MKIRYTDGKRKGQSVEVLDAAGRRLIDSGIAEEVKAKRTTSAKSETKSDS